jgi:hypothetical protein
VAGRSWRWLIRIVVVALLASAVLAASGIYTRHRNAERLRAVVAELDARDPDWRIEAIEAKRAAVPDAENSARRVLAAAHWLPPAWPPATHRDIFRLPPGVPPKTGQLAALQNELAECQIALAEALPLADMPRGRYDITYPRSLANSKEIPHRPQARQVGTLLYFDALLRALDHDPARAMRSCRACLNAARSIGDEPMTVPQLVRVIVVDLACLGTEQTLERTEPGPEDLAALQRLLEDEDAFPRLAVALRGERACMHRMFENLDRDPELAAANEPEEVNHFTEFLWGPSRQYEHPHMLELFGQRLAAAERLPLHELADEDRAVAVRLAAMSRDEVAFTRKAFLSLDTASGAFLVTHARLRCLIACLAADRYRHARGRWPEALADLVPAQLDRVPTDPFNGQPLHYARLEDGIRIYSVGPDGADDGGRLGNNDAFKPAMDLGIRLREAERRVQRHPED